MGQGGFDSGGEERRLAALLQYGVLDTPEEAAFDRLTELAARIFRTRVATISFVDRERQWLKSRHGIDVASWPRMGSFCEEVILSGKVTVVNDASTDERFRDHPMVNGPLDIRFYAGAPLVTPEGACLGAFAVMDSRFRDDWREEQTATLVDLASTVMHELSLNSAIRAGSAGQTAISNESRLHAMMESASQAILAVNHKGLIEMVNQKTEEMFGYARSEMMGRPLELLLPGRFAAKHAEHRRQYFTHPHARPMGIGMDLAGRRKNGQEFPVEISLNYAEVGGHAIAMAFVTDISERIRLEQQLRQSQKMEAVGQLAGGVAHDFNNLLTVIQGYSSMSLDGLAPEDPLREPLEEIEKAALSAGALTRQLLTFSRRQVIRPKVITLNAVINQIEKMLRRVIGEDVELVFACGTDPGTIMADPGAIEQILMNLTVNARDAMPDGGSIVIETANLFLDQEYAETHLSVNTGMYALLAVSDTGTGMTPEIQARIFEPFFTTKPHGQGTGLGLATVYGIVQQMGGAITVYSEVGRGSTFKVLFPVVQSAESAQFPVETSVAVGGGETILLVEDEPGVRKFVQAMLEKSGYNVLVAESSTAALDIAADSALGIDLLLTDVVMPGMNGPELVIKLLALYPTLRVLFMSGYTDRAFRLQERFAGDVALIEKPFTQQMLARKVGEVLGSEAQGE